MNLLRSTLIAIVMLMMVQPASPAPSELFVETFGESSNPAVIFLHGGPGYNSSGFRLGAELSAAQTLANTGFYVIAYDRRGCGNSESLSAHFTFDQSTLDIVEILDDHGVERVHVIGHSFGGAVALKLAEQYPDRVRSITLVGAPLNYPQTFTTIQAHCRTVYSERADSASLRYLDMLAAMDTTKLEYATYSFMHAMACGLYSASNPTDDAKAQFAMIAKSPDVRLLSDMKQPPVRGFYTAHKYTTMDFGPLMTTVKEFIPVYGIYGVEDGLFSIETRSQIRQIVGEARFEAVEGASHSVFIDQRDEFIRLFKAFVSNS